MNRSAGRKLAVPYSQVMFTDIFDTFQIFLKYTALGTTSRVQPAKTFIVS
jgi:hypothetical protein